ncbi:MAG: NADPH:quinone oxidoreductase family protein [Pseudomonadota bacterium]
MKAIICERLDGADGLAIADRPEPQPAPHEALIEVSHVGLNFMDTLITRGRYQEKPELQFVVSAELAGRVQTPPSESTGLRAGDRVMAYVGIGAAQERVAVAAERVVKVPAPIDLSTAAGLSVTYGAAVYALKRRAQVSAGETVAVTGASSGSGLAAIAVAKALGARVVAIASTEKKLAVCRRHGADDGILADAETLKAELRAATNGGPDVIYDCVGGELCDPALRALKSGGRYIIFGFAGGIPAIRANVALLKDCDLLGINWPASVAAAPDQHASDMDDVLKWLAHGRLPPPETTVRPFSDGPQAIADLAARRVIGKVVLEI